MKLPSLFRTVSPTRFDIKPRYYDPIKEELAERTSRIKREMEEEGLLDSEERESHSKSFGGNIRGSFAKQRGLRSKSSPTFNSTTLIRTVLFFVMVIGTFGYIYLGSVILNYMLYGAIALGGIFYGVRFLRRARKDD